MAWPQKVAEFLNRKTTEEPSMAIDPEKKPDEMKTSSEKSIAETIAESLKPFGEAVAALRQDIETLKQPRAPERPAQPTERISVLDDEDAAFNQRMTPILQSQLELEARINMRDVKAEYVEAGFGSVWSQFEKDILNTLDGTALVTPDGQGGFKKLRGDAQYIRNVADMIIGRAAKAGGVKFDGSKKTFFLEGSNSNESAGGSRAAETDGLTAKQVKLAQRMGIPLDKMKATVAKLTFTN